MFTQLLNSPPKNMIASVGSKNNLQDPISQPKGLKESYTNVSVPNTPGHLEMFFVHALIEYFGWLVYVLHL